MARKQKSREVAPNSPRGGRERVNLDRDNIELDPPQRRRSVRNYVSASTNVWSIVSILLVIAMIGTVFIAYSNVSGSGDRVYFFSPSAYLNGLSDSFYVPSGYYQLYYLSDRAGVSPAVESWSAYIDVDGRRYYSNENNVAYSQLFNPSFQFSFDIAGSTLYSRGIFDYLNNDDFSGVSLDHSVIGDPRLIYIDEPVMLSNAMPNIKVVGDAWGNVNGLNDIFNAFRITGEFVTDSVRYETQLIQSLLPWNSVVEGDRDYLPDLWEAAEERNGF